MEEICGRRMNLDKRGERKIGRFVGEKENAQDGETGEEEGLAGEGDGGKREEAGRGT